MAVLPSGDGDQSEQNNRISAQQRMTGLNFLFMLKACAGCKCVPLLLSEASVTETMRSYVPFRSLALVECAGAAINLLAKDKTMTGFAGSYQTGRMAEFRQFCPGDYGNLYTRMV